MPIPMNWAESTASYDSIQLHDSMPQSPLTSPMMRLPRELITEILIYIQDDSICAMSKFHSSRWNHGGLPNYISICKFIRDVALGSPELWSRIALGDAHARHLQRWIDYHLDHAGDYLCNVYFDLGPGKLGSALISSDLERLAHRTREMYVRNDDVPQSNIVHYVVEKSWPTLEKMTVITAEIGTGTFLMPNINLSSCGNVAVLGGHSDTLTSLHLTGLCATIHVLPHAPHLQHLSLAGLNVGISFMPLCALLRNTTQLLSLALDISFAVSHDLLIARYGPPGKRIKLPILQSLRMSGASGGISYMLGVLPHAQHILSIDSQDVVSEHRDVDRSPLIMQILEYIDRTSVHGFHPAQHKAVIEQMASRDIPRLKVCPLLPETTISGRVLANIDQCAYHTLTQVLNRMSAAEIRVRSTEIWVPIIEAASECTSEASVQELYIHHWKAKRSTCMAAFETYLSRRKERGQPFKKLVVGNGSPSIKFDQEMVKLWLEKGLVGEVVAESR